jgi:inorganic pyrophosphatase
MVHDHELVIDRPRGSRHPGHPAAVYPLDYGYLRGTSSGDGDGIDVWSGSLPEKRLVGCLCTVDLKKKDIELKLLLGCSETEIQAIQAFHDSPGMQSLRIFRQEMQDTEAESA